MDLSAALAYVRPRHRAVLAMIRSNGRPQLSNVMYALADDGLLRVSVTADRAKVANVARDPRTALHVTAEDFWSYVVLECDASLTPVAESPDDPTVVELVSLYREISGEHPDWDAYRAAMVQDRRRVMRLRPSHAYGALPRD
jgi:PPOX class probable F420-dependent enzyme